MKDFIHENYVLFVGVLKIVLTITVIAGLLFLCFYFKCYFSIYSKSLSLYLRIHKPKRNINTSDRMLFTISTKSKELHSLVVCFVNLKEITLELIERQENRTQPSFVLRPKTTPQNATSNRIALDF